MPEAFIILTFVLVACGMLMIYSSSVFYAQDAYRDPLYFFKREVMWVFAGLCAALVARYVHYQTVQKHSGTLLLCATVMLGLVFVPGIGHEVNNASRWLRVAGFTFQPSEFAKIAIIIFVADRLARERRHVSQFMRGVCVPLVMIGVPLGLILVEPDLGTPIVIMATVFALFYVGGTKLWHLIVMGACGIPVVAALIIRYPFRMRRLMTFMNPDADPLGAGFQIRQSLIAVGSGQINGVGLGKSVQKIHYLPEAHTDFVYAIAGEELGFVGAGAIIILFIAFLTVMYRLSRMVHDMFGHLVIVGVMTMIGLQTIINIGVVTGCLPTKGIALPFISYGGSSLVMTLAMCGFVVNIVENQARLRVEQTRSRSNPATVV